VDGADGRAGSAVPTSSRADATPRARQRPRWCSALDAQAEHLLFEQYALSAKRVANQTGAITVLVSHRFSTVRIADLILVVADGKVAESGSHAELMRLDGLYAELFAMQAAAYR